MTFSRTWLIRMAFDHLVLCAAEKVAGFLGYSDGLREHQKRIILELMKKRDVFGILPTGYGKSLCYTSMPLLYDDIYHEEPSIVVVVTPLIAIMKDQVILLVYNNIMSIIKFMCYNGMYYNIHVYMLGFCTLGKEDQVLLY